jgi:UDP-N-acetylmuramoyl-tripeptide--D-alanyl-D-alanine ligase
MEMGESSLQEHAAIVQLIERFTWKHVVLVGGDFSKVSHAFINFNNAGEAATWLKQQAFNNTQLLIKGSRSMQMEKVLQ